MTIAARTVLAIESSCDETAAAVVRGREVLSSVVASQAGLHDRYGGVVPEIASRRHLEVVDVVVAEALTQAGFDAEDCGPGRPPAGIDAVAVTQGPGLIGALLVGVAAAKARAWAWGVPLICVDHLLGHVASALLAGPDAELPLLCLLASGGHTLVLDVDEELAVTLLGSTRDDAAGEAFDKGARMLGLGMPGGPLLERLAADGDVGAAPHFTPAMVHHHDTLDTSFAGVKTALAVALREHPDAAPADLAAAYQQAVVETLVGCVRKAIRRMDPARRTLAVVGGVAANTLLRGRVEELCRENDMRYVAVPLRYCADNAAMIGVASMWCDATESPHMQHVDAFATSRLFRSGKLVPTVASG
jgi:N6-L-threonylcarbamoyladenine synthase